jgi:hypothetical protein
MSKETLLAAVLGEIAILERFPPKTTREAKRFADLIALAGLLSRSAPKA